MEKLGKTYKMYAIFSIVVVLSALVHATAEEPKAEEKTGKNENGQPKSTSIALRVRRVTYEDAYIAVPATSKIMKEDKDGNASIDFEAFVAEAVRLSKDPKAEWKVESTSTKAHPKQKAAPQDRKTYDGFYDLPKQ